MVAIVRSHSSFRQVASKVRDLAREVVGRICPVCRAGRSSQNSYAQEGEDRILASIFHDRVTGFYVDVGAHHPKWCSVTYLFYEMGWRGLAIDPLPGMKAEFALARPNDIALEVGIGAESADLTYTQYEQAAFNTFDQLTVENRKRDGRYPPPLRSSQSPVLPLRDVFAQHLSAGQRIDFLNVDVEGMDLPVLQSNDWTKWKPIAIVAEGALTVRSALASPITSYLESLGYALVARTRISNVYVLESEPVIRPSVVYDKGPGL